MARLSLIATAAAAAVSLTAAQDYYEDPYAPKHDSYPLSPPVYHPPAPKPLIPFCPKKPCCLSGFDKLFSYGYGGQRKDSGKLKPKLDVPLFDECPKHKNDKTVCDAVAGLYTKYGTDLSPKDDYRPREIKLSPKKSGYAQHNQGGKVFAPDGDNGGYSPASGYGGGYVRAYASTGFEGKRGDAESPSYTRVEDPAIIDGEWYSDTNADVVAIGVGCCYNVFANVKIGDRLDASCENDVLGNSNELFLLLKYSVIAAGRLDLNCPVMVGTCEFPNAVIVGDDLTVQENAFAFDQTPPSNSVQYWAGISLQVGDDILPDGGPDDLAVDGNFEQYENGLNFARVDATGGETRIDQEAVDASIEAMEARICALSDQLKTQKQTTEPYSNGATLIVDCTDVKKTNNCVANIEGEELESVDNIEIITNGIPQVIINVTGETVRVTLDGYTVDDIDASIIWNFHKANVLEITVDTSITFQGHIVAPRAFSLIFTGGRLGGAILNGRPDSTTTYTAVPFESNDPFPLAPVEPVVTLCSCLCQQDCIEKKKY